MYLDNCIANCLYHHVPHKILPQYFTSFQVKTTLNLDIEQQRSLVSSFNKCGNTLLMPLRNTTCYNMLLIKSLDYTLLFDLLFTK